MHSYDDAILTELPQLTGAVIGVTLENIWDNAFIAISVKGYRGKVEASYLLHTTSKSATYLIMRKSSSSQQLSLADLSLAA